MATDETGQDPKLPPDARLESLEERLDRLQQVEAKRVHKVEANPTNRIWQLMFSHLVGAPVGGGIIGWGIDSLAAYETYRARLRSDSEALANFALAQSKRIILREERNFVQVVEGTFALPPQ